MAKFLEWIRNHRYTLFCPHFSVKCVKGVIVVQGDVGELLSLADRNIKMLIVSQPRPWSCHVCTYTSYSDRMWSYVGSPTILLSCWRDENDYTRLVGPRSTAKDLAIASQGQNHICFSLSLCSQSLARYEKWRQEKDMAWADALAALEFLYIFLLPMWLDWKKVLQSCDRPDELGFIELIQES